MPKLKYIHRAKSYGSISEFLGPESYNNLLFLTPTNGQDDKPTFNVASGETGFKLSDYASKKPISPHYVTKELYSVAKSYSSSKTDVLSTSTSFYDLDEIAMVHSFPSLLSVERSRSNFVKNGTPEGILKNNTNTSDQKYTKHQLELQENAEIHSKKEKKKNTLENVDNLNKEGSNGITNFGNISVIKDECNKLMKSQKNNMYHTQFNNHLFEDKKFKKKDKFNPEKVCTCLLFSCDVQKKKCLIDYKDIEAPITDNTKNIEENYRMLKYETKDRPNNRKGKRDHFKQNKPTKSKISETINAVPDKTNIVLQFPSEEDICNSKKPSNDSKKTHESRHKCRFHPLVKSRRLKCPECKEEIEVEFRVNSIGRGGSRKYESSLKHKLHSPTVCPCKITHHAQKNISPCDVLGPKEHAFESRQHTDMMLSNLCQRCVTKDTECKSLRVNMIKTCRHHAPPHVPTWQRESVL